MRKTIQLENVAGAQSTLAEQIAAEYTRWVQARAPWEKSVMETRNYIFATDTRTTSNASLPWKNKTTLPKLCQIRDNLHANYMSALFPHEDWFTWQGAGDEDNTKDKVQAVTGYMKAKIRESGFMNEVSKAVYDWIDAGNCFGQVLYDHEVNTSEDLSMAVKYSGPRLERLSPFGHVFDITASDYINAPKITRHLMPIGTLAKVMKTRPDDEGWSTDAWEMARGARRDIGAYRNEDVKINGGIQIDGFGSLWDYYNSGSVEILEFEGDIYDAATDTLYENHVITVLDRRYVLRMSPMPSWLGISNKHHAGWRYRPDNLMGMGPLDNLVGMQYRIDHLENLKADVFDQIANPIYVQYGHVEEWEPSPGVVVHADQDSRIDTLKPDATALNANIEIASLMNLMEEMAGAPKQAMGIRTPGEKTAFEVGELMNAAGRIFQNKITQFENMFLEPILNQMLEIARRHLENSGPEVIRVLNDELGVKQFMEITVNDIKAKGTLVPKGARHFARKAQLIQNIHQFVNSAAYSDPGVQRHVSGLKLAQVYEELMEIEKFGLVQPNVRIGEEAEAQELAAVAQQGVDETAMIQPDLEATGGPPLEQPEAQPETPLG